MQILKQPCFDPCQSPVFVLITAKFFGLKCGLLRKPIKFCKQKRSESGECSFLAINRINLHEFVLYKLSAK